MYICIYIYIFTHYGAPLKYSLACVSPSVAVLHGFRDWLIGPSLKYQLHCIDREVARVANRRFTDLSALPIFAFSVRIDGDNDGGSTSDGNSPGGGGGYCFDPSTPIQMADGSEKKIKNIQLGDDTKGGEVTGVFQFKASDEIHNYKGVTVAGSHYVKEDGRFIMVKDSPLSTKINKIPVVYSLDTSGRRIFINDIEFADYNGDGVAKNFLNNAGVDLSGFDKEVLRQVEQRLI